MTPPAAQAHTPSPNHSPSTDPRGESSPTQRPSSEEPADLPPQQTQATGQATCLL
ncbi:hypothetical protein Micbo1qcDRAFT_170111, partial [Microdochium bolleyi]